MEDPKTEEEMKRFLEENKEVEDAEVVEETKDVDPAVQAELEKKKLEIEEQKKFFQLLRQGALFLKYVNKDLARQRKEKLNRASRRRIEKALQKGVFTQDVIDAYCGKLNDIIEFFGIELEKIENEKPKNG